MLVTFSQACPMSYVVVRRKKKSNATMHCFDNYSGF